MIRIGSLFSGIGGLELGLEWALAEAGVPARVVWQVEREPFPRAVLARHWPEADRSIEDVCVAGSSTLACVDLICGGFPCQDLSYAGKGAGLAGERSGLWREYARVLREIRPRFVVVENVAALLARGLGDVLGDLAALGYDAQWRCIRASDVGAPHRRERLFIVAYAGRGGVQRGGGPGDVGGAARKDRGGGDQRERDGDAPRHGGEAVGDTNGQRERQQDDAPATERNRRARTRTDARGADRRIAQSGVGGAPHGLSAGVDRWPAGPAEAQRDWEAPRTAKGVANRAARLKALGNAVVPQVAREVGRRMIALWLLDDARAP